ncbi:chromosome segregation protein SMC, partial [Jatrophihabitans sp. YIM 134969]
MHLQTLTVKGFKSFASATTLRFEPGITAVVGPNGSGKSNVVDAIAWVLGEQGAKALRGGKMEDVIFAGTAGRPPLGRAEVTLTINNDDGALPIEYSEVSITRRMFRDGASEYEINGNAARLLDIQELLSDSGIGREMHVIVGQGRLDSVLQARPEDRRGFIEEAAGVLKHRKRKEKALRKLDAMQANLTRVTDLTAELRRQLGPLGRQAEAARRAAGVQSDLRDARLRLMADDLAGLAAEVDRDSADENVARERRAAADRDVTATDARVAELDAELATSAPQLAHAQQVWLTLSHLAERVRGTASLAAERARHLAAEPDQGTSGPDPEALEAEADAVAAREAELAAELAALREALGTAVATRTDADTALSESEAALRAAARAVADRREGLAKLTGQVQSLRTRATAANDEITRLTDGAEAARQRASAVESEAERVQAEAGDLDVGEVGLDERHEAAEAAYEAARERVDLLAVDLSAAEKDLSTWSARAEALALGLTRKDGGGTLLAAADELGGVLGSVPTLLAVEPGFEAAVAGALGPLADAVAVGSGADAVRAVEHLREHDAGRAALVVGGDDQAVTGETGPAPEGARWALDVVTPAASVRAALTHALAGIVCVDDLAAAAAVLADHPGLKAVTRGGDVVERWRVSGGSSSAPSTLEIQAAADEAQAKAADASSRVERLRVEADAARGERADRQAEVETALAALHESDAALAAVQGQLAELGERARSAAAEAARLEEAARAAEAARDRDVAGLADLEERLANALAVAADQPLDVEPDSGGRDAAAAAADTARSTEIEARLAVRTAEERSRAVQGRADALRRRAAAERTARAQREKARVARVRAAAVAAGVR